MGLNIATSNPGPDESCFVGNTGRPLAQRSVLACYHLTSRLLNNYLRCLCGVKHGLKMLIYSSKLRFFGHFCLASPASKTFFHRLLEELLPASITIHTTFD